MVSAWVGVSASVRGSSHVRSGLVNQDAVGVARHGDGLVAAVADGHGGNRYVRSDRGARFAVALALELGGPLLEDTPETGPASRPSRELMAALMAQVVPQWRAAVLADAAAAPFTAEERTRAGVELDGDVTVAYGATLLVTIASSEGVGLAQLGDGDVVAVGPDGVAARPVPDDPRLVAGQTTSLCLASALEDIRYGELDAEQVELLVLCSDGYGNSFAEERWREDVAADLLDDVRRRGIDGVGTDLPDWLAQSAEAGGDDVSMAVLHRRPGATNAPPRRALGATTPSTVRAPGSARPAAPTPAHAPAARPSPAREAAEGATRRRPWAWALAALVCGVILGAVLGWLAGSGDDEPAAATTSTVIPPSSTTTAAPTTVAEATPARVLIGGDGFGVEFSPDVASPGAQRVESVLPAVTLVERSDGSAWEVTSAGSLRSTSAEDESTLVDLGGAEVGGLLLAGPALWVVSSDGSTLFAVDTTNGTTTSFAVVEAGTGGPVGTTGPDQQDGGP